MTTLSSFHLSASRNGYSLVDCRLITGCGGSIPTPASTTTPPASVTLQGQLTDAFTGEPIVGAQMRSGCGVQLRIATGIMRSGFPPIAARSGPRLSGYHYFDWSDVAGEHDQRSHHAALSGSQFSMPVAAATTASTTHDFTVGKLSASIRCRGGQRFVDAGWCDYRTAGQYDRYGGQCHSHDHVGCGYGRLFVCECGSRL